MASLTQILTNHFRAVTKILVDGGVILFLSLLYNELSSKHWGLNIPPSFPLTLVKKRGYINACVATWSNVKSFFKCFLSYEYD